MTTDGARRDDVTIEVLGADDRGEAVAVINAAAGWYAAFLPPGQVPDPEMTPEEWSAEAERMTWYGAVAVGRLVGVIGLEYADDAALLRHWYVRPADQRRGVGTRLREHLERQVEGVERIIAGTYADNHRARSALEQAGYRPSPDPQAVLEDYYAVPEHRRDTSVTYERSV